ncbi:ABC transporter ATP-binding protein [Candidatus Mcinerneyibacteriota bacterium]|nr:ABC transporter ATP-binding protein [Candidatus Mcinerneyibacteriota bacterium]
MEKVLESRGLWFAYDDDYVLEDISVSVDRSDFVAIVGPNGGGKTTLVKLITGLLQPTMGTLTVLGGPPAKAGSRIGYVPQFSTMDASFPITVLEVVLQGLFHKSMIGPAWKRDAVEQGLRSLEQLGIADLAGRHFGQLSGGQKQRTLLARALVSSPELLILDEPTSSVDIAVEEDIYELFKELNSVMTILLVTHDITFVSSYVNKVMCLNRRSACHATEEIALERERIAPYGHKVTEIRHQCGL